MQTKCVNETEYGVRTKRKERIKETSLNVATWVILSIFVVIALFPIYFMLLLSITSNKELLGTPALYPKSISFEPYKYFFKAEYLFGYKDSLLGWRNGYLLNSLIVCAANVFGVVLTASLTAYGITKVSIKGKDVIFFIILSTVLLPGTVTSIPLYIVYNKMGWNGTLLPLTVPIWFGGGAMNIFLIRQFIKGVPSTYSEAAILDGCSTFGIYWKIILPLIRPILVYLAVTTFIGTWNDFQGPLLYLGTNKQYYTLSLALYKDFAATGSGFLANSQMAVGVMMMIPCTVLFAVFQKEILEGIGAFGGIKG